MPSTSCPEIKPEPLKLDTEPDKNNIAVTTEGDTCYGEDACITVSVQ